MSTAILALSGCGPASADARQSPSATASAAASAPPSASATPTSTPSGTATAEATDAPSDAPTEDASATPKPTASASAGVIDDDFSDVPPGDQPIGFKFPPPPGSFSDLRVPKGKGAQVYFTFDDGPSTFTRQVLDALAEVDAPAVFCLIGDNAVARPKDVRALVAAGHSLCDHSRDHAASVGGRNRATVKAEIEGGLRQIRSVAGDAPVHYYRQPFGAWTAMAVKIMYDAGMVPLRWSADPRDWSRPGRIAIAQRVLLRLRPGAVVLMHDGGGDRTQTVAALRWLLPRLRDAGWKFGLAPQTRLSPEDAARPE